MGTVHDDSIGYGPVMKMSACDPNTKWQQLFTFGEHACGARPIRYTKDPSRCVDALHYDHVVLSNCSGADTQKFLWKCDDSQQQPQQCYIQRAGRKDMCLWWDDAIGDADLELRNCNIGAKNADIGQQ